MKEVERAPMTGSELSEALRDTDLLFRPVTFVMHLCTDAADEIERLRQQVKELDQENRHLLEELEDKKDADEALIAVEIALDSCGLTGTYAAQIEKLKAQIAFLRESERRDAERYRWIVRDANGKWLNKLMEEYTRADADCERFDAAVDEAMGKPHN